MAEKKEPAKAAEKKQAPKKQPAKAVAKKQEVVNTDPALAKYNALMVQNDDKKRFEQSLLISLCVFIVLTFIVFPEFAKKIAEAQEEEAIIEIPKQTIVKQEKKQEQKREVQRKTETKKRNFNQVPDIAKPTGDIDIVEDIPLDKLEVEDEFFDDMEFGDAPDEAPGPIEIAGDVVKPQLMQKGAKPYPPKAKMMRRSGKVTARVIVKKDGSYEIVQILKETPPDFGFADAFRQYLQQCGKFKPATRNGKPVEVYYNITLLWNM
jgi:TonB family protein